MTSPISGNDRLIIILGMAHSGTTILAHVLSQHPDVVLAANGQTAVLLENEWLVNADPGPIQALLQKHSDKRVLLKRPWNEIRQAEWMAQVMPDARYIYCVREFHAIATSWKKPTSLVEKKLRDCNCRQMAGYFAWCRDKADRFAATVAHCCEHCHEAFLADPATIMEDTAAWLGLAPFSFDVSQVGTTDIKAALASKKSAPPAPLRQAGSASCSEEPSPCPAPSAVHNPDPPSPSNSRPADSTTTSLAG